MKRRFDEMLYRYIVPNAQARPLPAFLGFAPLRIIEMHDFHKATLRRMIVFYNRCRENPK
jgi:hypothetical protein